MCLSLIINIYYTIGENEITFKIDAEYSLFKDGGKVYIDDKEITDYTSKDGSTIITLGSDYLKTLSKGNHTIRVTFNDGKYAQANFQVKEKEIETPNTVDSIALYISLLGICMVGIIGISIYKKK